MLPDTSSQPQRGAGLEEYLHAVRARKSVVAIAAVVALALALAYAVTRSERYEASARVLVAPTLAGSTDERPVPVNLEREREILVSLPVATSVARLQGPGTEPAALLQGLNVTFRPNTDVLNLSYTHAEPEVAQAVADDFAQTYTDMRVQAQTSWFEGRRQALQGQIEQLTADAAAMGAELAALDQQRTTLQVDTTVTDADRAARLLDLDADRDNLRDARAQLEEQSRGLRAALLNLATIEQSQQPPAEVLELAGLPTAPLGLGTTTLGVAGLLFGLAAGVAIAFVLERLDTSVRDRGDVEQALGRPVLGAIPQFPVGNRLGAAALVMNSQGDSPGLQRSREAFRRLRASLLFSTRGRDSAVFLVTSLSPGEGKSVITANLGIAAAQAGRQVALVSGDLRNSRLEDLFSVPEGPGLAELLDGDDAGQPVPLDVPNLYLLRSGWSMHGIGELLTDDVLGDVVAQLRKSYDLVLIDSPPMMSAADAAMIAPHVDGVVLVVAEDQADVGSLVQARDELDQVGGILSGAVLNRDSSTQSLFSLRREPEDARSRTRLPA